MEMNSILDELSELEITNFDNRQFIPVQKLVGYFTKERVLKILEAHADIKFYNREEIAQVILNNGTKLFAIMLNW
ncbi:hypothetical protein MMC14_007199, partial [Varicellaria rhodocarpa]|nr:hypothetical protein [Varicellaria rhodocarpa]